MIFGLFRRAANDAVIDRLYLRVVDASRRPALYSDLGVPDTFEGRFESLALHAILVLRRLNGCEAPGPEVSQHLVDTVFKHFDRTLREMGVGDTTVPKRMKTMAEAFAGRSAAYDAAVRAGSAGLQETLERNVYAGRGDAAALARYVEATIAGLDGTTLQVLLDGELRFPDPASFARERP